jgi:surface protein
MIGIGIRLVGGGIVNQLPFRFTVNTNNTSAGSSTSTQFKLPLVSSGTLNAVVDWGDGTSNTITTWNQAEVTHTYATAGVYDIKITGVLRGWQFNNGGDRLKILNITNWSGLIIDVGFGFRGCSNLTASAIDAPTITSTTLNSFFNGCTNFNSNIGNWSVSNVQIFQDMFLQATNFNNGNADSIKDWSINNATNLQGMFYQTSFNQPIGTWNVSNVTNMSIMFFNSPFNQNINSWNTSNVTTMREMFYNNAVFNQNIGSWNTSAVTDMSSMFWGASTFNQPIGSWNVSKVTNMSSMFKGSSSFNQDIGSWNVGLVINMSNMFQDSGLFNNGGSSSINNWNTISVTNFSSTFYNSNFNQPIGNWNVSNVTNMNNMFRAPCAFNQNIGSWNISNVTSFVDFMNGRDATSYSASNLNAIYNGWSSRPVQPNLSISFGSIKYTAEAQVGKNILDFAPNNWTIVDGGI